MDKIKDFFNGRFFEPRYKIGVHITQFVLVIAVLALSGARVATRPSGVPTSRGDTIALTMSAKTLIVLLYQVLTSHASRFKKWASLKAYMILNILEIVFWFAVIVLTLMGNTRSCQGTSCALSWVVCLVALFMVLLSCWMAVVSTNDFRYFKATGVQRGASLPIQRQYNPNNGDNSSISFQSMRK